MSTSVLDPGPAAAPIPVRAARRSLIARLAGCMSVSVITTVISLTTLGVLTAGLGVTAWMANVVATAVATVPSYSLNRRFVWRKRGASDPWREVLPFWSLSFAGLVLSTIAVGVTDKWATGLHLTGVIHTASLMIAHLAGFGALWIVQFVLLDRVLFAPTAEEIASQPRV